MANRQRQQKTFRLAPILLLIMVMISACQTKEATPILVYVTTTPDTELGLSLSEPDAPETILADSSRIEPNELATSDSGLLFPGPSPTPPASLTPTPSPTIATPAATNTAAAPSFPNVPSADQLPVLTRSRMGIQLHPLIEQAAWEQMLGLVSYQLGVGWIKIQIKWDDLEPQQGQYSADFYTYVQRVQHASFAQLKVMISVVDAPDWARPAGFNPALEGPPADPQHLANFIQQFIIATKPEDRRIAAIEIWNEPNLRDREWDGMSVDGATYMRYFAPAYQAIKATDPNIIVVTAGLAPVGDGVESAVSDRRYLQQMYDAGLASYPDVRIGVHPYGWGNSPDATCCTDTQGWANNRVFYFQDTLQDYISIMQRNGHFAKLWVTEFGWGTYNGVGAGGTDVTTLPDGAEFFALVNSEQQAQYTLRAFELIQTPPFGDSVELAFLWNLNFAALPFALDQRLEQAGYSLLDASANPRLIYLYLMTARRHPEP